MESFFTVFFSSKLKKLLSFSAGFKKKKPNVHLRKLLCGKFGFLVECFHTNNFLAKIDHQKVCLKMLPLKMLFYLHRIFSCFSFTFSTPLIGIRVTQALKPNLLCKKYFSPEIIEFFFSIAP